GDGPRRVGLRVGGRRELQGRGKRDGGEQFFHRAFLLNSEGRSSVARMSKAICGDIVPGFRFAHPGYYSFSRIACSMPPPRLAAASAPVAEASSTTFCSSSQLAPARRAAKAC